MMTRSLATLEKDYNLSTEYTFLNAGEFYVLRNWCQNVERID